MRSVKDCKHFRCASCYMITLNQQEPGSINVASCLTLQNQKDACSSHKDAKITCNTSLAAICTATNTSSEIQRKTILQAKAQACPSSTKN